MAGSVRDGSTPVPDFPAKEDPKKGLGEVYVKKVIDRDFSMVVELT